MCDGDTLEGKHVQQALRSGRRPSAAAPAHFLQPSTDAPELPPEDDTAAKPGMLKSLEYAALKQLASAHQGNRAELAKKLGISERSLYRKLKALGV